MKLFNWIKVIVYVICSILILVFANFFVDHLRIFIGILMTLYGAVGILGIAIEKIKPIYNGHGFVFNFLEILLGVIILALVDGFQTICIIWATWSIFRETIEIREIIERKLHSALAIISFIESIAVIVISILLIKNPVCHHATIHTYLLCVELVMAGSIPILNSFLLKKVNNEED